MTLFSKRFIIPTFAIAFLYVILITYSMNVRILKDTLFGDYNAVYKLRLLFSLLQGMWTAMSGLGLTILFLIALLTGASLTLLFSKMSLLKIIKNYDWWLAATHFLVLWEVVAPHVGYRSFLF